MKGSDSNDGTLERPFKTLEKARDTIHELGAERTLPATVYLRGGTYEMTDTFKLESNHSGTGEYPIEYRSYPGERAILTGAKKIERSSFERLTDETKLEILADPDAKSKIVVADLVELGLTDYGKIDRRGHEISSGTPPQMELLMDGKRMTLARWPNEGFTTYSWADKLDKDNRNLDDVLAGTEFEVYKTDENARPEDYERLLLWNNPSEIFVSGTLGPNYAYDYFPVGDIREDGDTVTVQLRQGAVVKYYTDPYFYYENIFEEIDAPGEYYINREEGKIYFYPPAGFGNNSDIRVTYMEGKPLVDIKANHITLSNMSFEGSRNRAISASDTDNLNIIKCQIQSFAERGISIANSTNALVSGCSIQDIGSDGIAIGGGNYQQLISANNIIENNEISKCGYIERSYKAGILLSYNSVGTIVRNNKLYDMPHMAINIYGSEHRIEYNEIYDVVKEFHDMDAIYTNMSDRPWERGLKIRWNYIHDIGRQKFPKDSQINIAGIRSDNGGHGLLVEGNVFADIGGRDANNVRGVCAWGTYNTVQNNIFVNSSGTFDLQRTYTEGRQYDMTTDKNKALKQAMDASWVKGIYFKKYPELERFFEEHPQSAKTNVFKNNLIVEIDYPLSDILPMKINDDGYLGAEQLVDSVGNLRTTTDPGFTDYENKNYNLEGFSGINGFKNIPFSKIGLR